MSIKINQIAEEPRVLLAQASAPTTGSGRGSFYALDIGGSQTEAAFADESGNVTQLTDAGKINLAGSDLNDLGDVNSPSPSPGEVLTWNGTAWVPQTVSGSGEVNTASNSASGTGTGLIFKGKVGVDLVFKRILAGSGVSITNGTDDITISAPGSGEANTASNLGAGDGIFASKVGVDLQFKSLVAGANVTLTPAANTITISATGGGGGPSIGVSSVNRYQIDSTVNYETYVVSSSEVLTGLSWTRTVTLLEITSASHGLSIGDRVIIANTNEDLITAIITSTTINTFTVNCANTGTTSGSAASYSVGVTGSWNTGTNELTINMPFGGNVRLLSINGRLTSNGSGVADIIINSTGPQNGVGGTTDLSDANIPLLSVRANADTLTAVGATLAINNAAAGYDRYRLGALGTSLIRIYKLQF